MSDYAQARLPYVYTDRDGDTIEIGSVLASSSAGDRPVVSVTVAGVGGVAGNGRRAVAYIELADLEAVITAQREAAKAADKLTSGEVS
ncbi:hypothetical protein [Streptomyces sp. MP131-18]|uniref:hypothetical protein n=1 Tax=Streptomyces sp. MP131-18 TaxID=1857892 RepID=UPI0011807CD3|nr:hypothetical protein [Streptomyces sp. MP131-18]